MRTICLMVLASALVATMAWAQFEPYFTVEAELSGEGAGEMRLSLTIPADGYVYADSWEVLVDGVALLPLSTLPAIREFDEFSGEERDLVKASASVSYAAPAIGSVVEVLLQGCADNICYPPEEHYFRREGASLLARVSGNEGAATEESGDDWLAGMRIRSAAAGYVKPEAFLDFLKGGVGGGVGEMRAGAPGFAEDPIAFLARRGWWVTLLLILLGGLLLNLTPCVLPMIPINLAIIGAGARGGARGGRGFLLGGVYGAGMALAYGLLGLSVVATGGFFGALQSSPIFNLTIAAVFVVLALALFDVFPIDFSRFQRSGGSSGAGMGVVLALGAMSALLAGACVAPVVLAVLLLAGKLHAEGLSGALLLPFLLGVGMALPWPLAGAGLAVLPKPGGWMRYVKGAFGVVILLMALYYAKLGYGGLVRVGTKGSEGSLTAGDHAAWEARIDEARKSDKPILLDFWATWCKNCAAMEKTTLREASVAAALDDYILIRVQAERPGDEPARSHLRALGVKGLPSYVILER